jgi:hypothetical protein
MDARVVEAALPVLDCILEVGGAAEVAMKWACPHFRSSDLKMPPHRAYFPRLSYFCLNHAHTLLVPQHLRGASRLDAARQGTSRERKTESH